MQYIEFIFRNFWTFIGTVIILSLLVKLIAVIILGVAAIIKGDGEIKID